MPTYNYECESCGHQETIEQDMGTDKEHECPECQATSRRVLKFSRECVSAAPTPGSCVNRSRETRRADEAMTRIRRAHGHKPHLDGNSRAADRHWGRRNGLI